MIPVLGRVLILASLLVSVAGAVLAFVAGRTRSADGLRWARGFAYLYGALIILAALLMEYALLAHDFTVSYVVQVGSRSVPTWVTIVSLWSSLEGSILFWGLVLGAYIIGACWYTRRGLEEYTPDAIGVWLACAAFFSFLIAAPANPFLTVMNPPLDGPGPNPLLQNHVLMAIHPPFLYLGYVGMTIPFGLACAALIRGKLGHTLLRPLRAALLLPWVFQTVAIMLGGWWAYEVLGWGGYWAWDPVENASLLPWLTATAALHSILVVERRGVLKGWTVTMVQSTFLLVLLGTFMTRSGVFNSVHSFTQSAIGPTILIFLAVCLLFSVALLAFRIDRLEAEGGIAGPMTREGMFLLNNLIFVLLTFTVLIGTVFPLIVEAVNGRQMSVGRPYFDRMVIPLGTALLFLLGVGPALPWGLASREQIRKALLPPVIGGVLLTVLGYAVGVRSVWTLVTLFFGGYAAQVTLGQMFMPMLQRIRSGDSFGTAFYEAQLRRGKRRFGSYIVHASVVIVIIAIAVSTSNRQTTEVTLTKGQTSKFGGHDLTFLGTETRREPHRVSTLARFALARDGRQLDVLEPRMNQYETMREPIGSPDVHSTMAGDYYIALVSLDPSAQRATVSVFVAPMVVWIWGAVIFMGLGGLVALLPTRRQAAPVASREEVPGAIEAT